MISANFVFLQNKIPSLLGSEVASGRGPPDPRPTAVAGGGWLLLGQLKLSLVETKVNSLCRSCSDRYLSCRVTDLQMVLYVGDTRTAQQQYL